MNDGQAALLSWAVRASLGQMDFVGFASALSGLWFRMLGSVGLPAGWECMVAGSLVLVAVA